MGKYRSLGTGLDKTFRNDLNANFDDIDKDIKAETSRAKAKENEIDNRVTNVNERISNIIAQSGTSDTEVVDARGGYPVLRDRLESIESQMAQTEKVVVNLYQFGAVDGGNIDQPFTDAVNYLNNQSEQYSGGKIIVPSGYFTISQPITLTSNIEVEGQGNSVIENEGSFVTNFFKCEGTFGQEIPLASDLTLGGNTISTISSHGLQVNDLALLMSQRDSMHADAGLDWRLGYPTGSTTAYFGEFVRVNEVLTDNSFKSVNGVIFPSYSKDKTKETSALARESATIKKFNPIQNVTIKNLKLVGRSPKAISFKRAINCKAENVEWTSTHIGIFIAFEESLSCVGKNNRVYCNVEVIESNLYEKNVYKAISSQNCGFVECYAENGTQPFDITYLGGSIPSSFCYIKNCETKGAKYHAATTHGGTYANQIIDNLFLENVKQGISVRSRKTIVKGNTVIGSNHAMGVYGIALYEGWARDCIIQGNVISGFDEGISTKDAATSQEYFHWVGAIISGNSITQVNKGVYIDRSTNNRFEGDTGILIQGNLVSGMIATNSKGVFLNDYVAGVRVVDNTFDGSGNANCGVYIDANADRNTVKNNTILNISGPAIWCAASTSEKTVSIGENEFANVSSQYNIGANVKVKSDFVIKGIPGSSLANNQVYIDSANVLRFKDNAGVVKSINVS